MNDPSPDLIKNVEIHQKLNEKQLSYDELFHRVDKNNDGKLDVNELIELLENVGMETSSKNRVAIAHVSSYNKSPVSGRMLKPDVFAITNS
jgi:Ca2+-binding EF-hand superfamily protein